MLCSMGSEVRELRAIKEMMALTARLILSGVHDLKAWVIRDFKK